jgi:hypothetical protein
MTLFAMINPRKSLLSNFNLVLYFIREGLSFKSPFKIEFIALNPVLLKIRLGLVRLGYVRLVFVSLG